MVRVCDEREVREDMGWERVEVNRGGRIITLAFGRWEASAGRFCTLWRIYIKGHWTPFCRVVFKGADSYRIKEG